MYVASMLFVIAAGFPVSPIVIVIAGLVLAAIVAVVAVFLLRSGKGKGAKAAANGASDWQPQGQQAAGNWNTPGAGAPAQDNAWGQPAPQQQAQGGWGQPQQPQQQAQGGWGATQPSWGTENAQQGANAWGNANNAQQQAANPWGGANNAQQQAPGWAAPAANQWGAGAQGASSPNQPPAWAAPNAAPAPATSPWDNAGQAQGAAQWGQGGQGGQGATQQPAWDNAPAARQQDPWGQQAASPWETQNSGSSPQQMGGAGQVAPTAYSSGGSGAGWNNQPNFGNSGGQAPADAWGAAANNAPWQQQQPNAGARPDPFANPDGDKTILRSASAPISPQMVPGMGTLGFVRVKEGKEPGRIYEIRKESLSIGRSRESDIFLEDLAVSRLHASILNQGNGTYILKDEGSANGTKVNGVLVSKYQTSLLNEGDEIQLGQTILVFNKR